MEKAIFNASNENGMILLVGYLTTYGSPSEKFAADISGAAGLFAFGRDQALDFIYTHEHELSAESFQQGVSAVNTSLLRSVACHEAQPIARRSAPLLWSALLAVFVEQAPMWIESLPRLAIEAGRSPGVLVLDKVVGSMPLSKRAQNALKMLGMQIWMMPPPDFAQTSISYSCFRDKPS